jgi:quercetin dioxygenase-like cupin family protein
MNRRHLLNMAAMTVLGLAALSGSVIGQNMGEHKFILPQDIKWGPAPPSFPPGAQVAVLYGDPSKEGMFVLRMKVPKDYYIPPHTHPKPEIVTVISGTTRVGMGTAADRGTAQAMSVSSFFALQPGSAHYVFADEDTVVQINSTGPWGINYVNPKDDPRQKTQ